MSGAIRFQVLEMFEDDCPAIMSSTGLLERPVTTLCFAASAQRMEAHFLLRSFAFMTAVSTVV